MGCQFMSLGAIPIPKYTRSTPIPWICLQTVALIAEGDRVLLTITPWQTAVPRTTHLPRGSTWGLPPGLDRDPAHETNEVSYVLVSISAVRAAVRYTCGKDPV